VHHGRVVKRTGDGILIEFRSVVDAVHCAIEVQNGAERSAGLPPERRVEFPWPRLLADDVLPTRHLAGDGRQMFDARARAAGLAVVLL
jgi:hypothetical protein